MLCCGNRHISPPIIGRGKRLDPAAQARLGHDTRPLRRRQPVESADAGRKRRTSRRSGNQGPPRFTFRTNPVGGPARRRPAGRISAIGRATLSLWRAQPTPTGEDDAATGRAERCRTGLTATDVLTARLLGPDAGHAERPSGGHRRPAGAPGTCWPTCCCTGAARSPRDVLMDTFWPDARPAAARNSLHVALTGVRRVLRRGLAGDGAGTPARRLPAGPGRCRLGRRRRVRAVLPGRPAGRPARRPRRGAGRLRGGRPALRGRPAGRGPVRGLGRAWSRESLRLDLLDVQRRLAELHAAAGDHAAAVLVARRALDIDPCNEPMHRQLMRSYHGDRPGAPRADPVPPLRRGAVAGPPGPARRRRPSSCTSGCAGHSARRPGGPPEPVL